MSTGSLCKKAIIVLTLASHAGCALVANQPSRQADEKDASGIFTDGDYPHAVSALKGGRNEEAMKLFNSVSKLHPELAAPYINIGLIQIKRGNLHSAETALLHAAALAPSQPEIYNSLGIIYRRMGRFNDAETAYLKALQCAPDYANAHLNIGILYDIYLDNLSAARDHYERYLTLSGGDNELIKKWLIDVNQRLARTAGAAK